MFTSLQANESTSFTTLDWSMVRRNEACENACFKLGLLLNISLASMLAWRLGTRH